MSHERLTSGGLLARNSVMNLGAGGLILLLNLLFVPAMLESFGLELYGVLSVTWMVLGHLKWLDLGFSVACAKYVSEDLAHGHEDRAGRWAWTAVSVQVTIGVVAAAVLWAVAPFLADLLKIDPARRDLVVLALRMFALVVPVDLASRSLNAVLEATQRFDRINALTILGAIWTFTCYGIGILRDGDFHAVVYGLVALRIATLIATAIMATRALPAIRRLSGWEDVVDRERVKEMFRFGGWVSVSAGIGPLIFFFDRWVISTIRGVAVLPLYTVPLQMLVSLQMIPASISSTLFPAFSMLQAKTRWDEVQDLVLRAHRYLLLGLLPVLTLLYVWAPEILRLWIDADFASQALLPFRILTIGFAVGLFAPFSGALLQGAGRPEILSKIYLVEAPINVLLTIILVRNWGVVGAAVAYTGRTIVETIILWVCIHHVFPLSRRKFISRTFERTGPVLVGIALLLFLFPAPSIHDGVAVGVTMVAAVAYAVLLHSHFLDAADRMFVRQIFARRRLRVVQDDR